MPWSWRIIFKITACAIFAPITVNIFLRHCYMHVSSTGWYHFHHIYTFHFLSLLLHQAAPPPPLLHPHLCGVRVLVDHLQDGVGDGYELLQIDHTLSWGLGQEQLVHLFHLVAIKTGTHQWRLQQLGNGYRYNYIHIMYIHNMDGNINKNNYNWFSSIY